MSDQSSGSKARPLPPPSSIHDLVTGGIEGAAGSAAIDPFMEKLMHGGPLKSPLREGWSGLGKRAAIYGAVGAGATGLIGALVSMTSRKHAQKKMDQQDFERLENVIELSLTEEALALPDTVKKARRRGAKRNTNTAVSVGEKLAGAGLVAAGAVGLKAGFPLIRSATRRVAAATGAKPTAVGAIARTIAPHAGESLAGKTVADYVNGAVKVLNSQPSNSVFQIIRDHVHKHPTGSVSKIIGGPQLAHYGGFRASPSLALTMWKDEVVGDIAKGFKEGISPERHASLTNKIAKIESDHQKVLDRIKYHAATFHQNEAEALQQVGTHSDLQKHFRRLVFNKENAPEMYGGIVAGGSAAAAGTGAALYHAGKKREREFEAIEPNMIEFDGYDPYSDRSLRSGVRLDKYEKTIKAREIDRHIHDYIRTAAIGAAAGAAIPARQSLKNRALIGAGGGVLVAGVLHSMGHVDPYGEQSEDAKIVQRNLPKYGGSAAVVGGLLARYRAKNKAVLSVVKKP
jgi:hypothetical protein